MHKHKTLIIVVSIIMVMSGLSGMLMYNGTSMDKTTNPPLTSSQISNVLPSAEIHSNQNKNHASLGSHNTTISGNTDSRILWYTESNVNLPELGNPESAIHVQMAYPSQEKYKVDFTETGIPAGITWNVGICKSGRIPLFLVELYTKNHQPPYWNSSSTTSMSDYLPNGTYYYYAGPTNTYLYEGSFTVIGASKNISISFPAFYKVTFSESGLPAGISWNVVATNTSSDKITSLYGISSSSKIVSYLPNGTYAFRAGALSSYILRQNITVNGQTQNLTVHFPRLYRITFVGENTYPGMDWCVFANVPDKAIQYINTSTEPQNVAYLPDGTYYYNASLNDEFFSTPHFGVEVGGKFNVSGELENITIQFPSTYKVTFMETNIHTGQNWVTSVVNSTACVYLNRTYSSSMVAYLPNGTYGYTAYTDTVSVHKQIHVSGQHKNISVVFPVTYQVTFMEKNMHAGQNWTISVSPSDNCICYSYKNIHTPFKEVYMKNGTYSYTAKTNGVRVEHGFNISGVQKNITVVFPISYKVIFKEQNLHQGQGWSVNAFDSNGSVNYYNETCDTPIIAYLPNGTYNYIANNNVVCFQHGFNISGVQKNITVVFPISYKVIFKEQNLHQGQGWSVNAFDSNNSVSYSHSTSGPSITAYLPNGTYNFTANTNGISVHHEFNVSGIQKNITVVFPVTYIVAFTEQNFPSGQLWPVKAFNSNGSVRYYNYTFGTCMIAYLPNGTYNYTAGSYRVYTGPIEFNVSGKQENITVVFPLTYKVTFTEKGLPPGTPWYLNITHGFRFSTVATNYITLSTTSYQLINGTYTYTVATINSNYSAHGANFTVDGKNVTESITFSESIAFSGLYTITFKESGLLNGTTWCVTGTSIFHNADSPANITFTLTNGTYSFTVTNLSGYYTTNSSFSVTINGNNTTETVHYDHWAYITGTISTGFETFTINGNPVPVSSSGHFNVSVASGTYRIVATESGHQTYHRNLTVNPGCDKSVTISLKPVSNPSPKSSIDIYAIIGVVAAVAVIGGAIVYTKKKH